MDVKKIYIPYRVYIHLSCAFDNPPDYVSDCIIPAEHVTLYFYVEDDKIIVHREEGPAITALAYLPPLWIENNEILGFCADKMKFPSDNNKIVRIEVECIDDLNLSIWEVDMDINRYLRREIKDSFYKVLKDTK